MRIRFSFEFLLWAALAYASIAKAQSPGTFTATGKMVIPRFLQTSTLLRGGSVLITGGGSSYGTDTAESSAELYDPATGTFTATGDMHEPYCDTATLLQNGKVLITRGFFYDLQTVGGIAL